LLALVFFVISDNIFFASERKKIIQEQEITQDQGSMKVKVGFVHLANIVSERWRNVSAEYKKKLEEMARIERQQYKRSVLAWKLNNAEDSMSLGPSANMNNEASGAPSEVDNRARMASLPEWLSDSFLSTTNTSTAINALGLIQSPSGVIGTTEFDLASASPFTNGRQLRVDMSALQPLPFKVEMAAASPYLFRRIESQSHVQFMRSPSHSGQSALANDIQPSSCDEMNQEQNTDTSVHSLFSGVPEMAHDNSTDLAWTLPIEEIQRFFGIDPEKYKIVTKHLSHR
jgi:hypothetical protein